MNIKLNNLRIEANKYTYDELREYLQQLRKTIKGMDAIAFEDFAEYVLDLKALADELNKENK